MSGTKLFYTAVEAGEMIGCTARTFRRVAEEFGIDARFKHQRSKGGRLFKWSAKQIEEIKGKYQRGKWRKGRTSQ